MVQSRLDLQAKLEAFSSKYHPGSKVYFEPGPDVELYYPCIVYTRSAKVFEHADDSVYRSINGYDVTIISDDPDEIMVEMLPYEFSHVSYGAPFVNDNLHHDLFLVYY